MFGPAVGKFSIYCKTSRIPEADHPNVNRTIHIIFDLNSLMLLLPRDFFWEAGQHCLVVVDNSQIVVCCLGNRLGGSSQAS